MPPKMSWWEKVLLFPFAVISFLLFGLGAAILSATWALLHGVFKLLDSAIENSDKPKDKD